MMDMPRPELPEVLKQKVEQLHEQHQGYSANSFQEALSTVVSLAEGSDSTTTPREKLPFEYDVEDQGSFIILHLKPGPETEWTKQGLEVGKATIKFDRIHESLKKIEGVRNAHSTSGETIDAIIPEDPGQSFDVIVDEIFSVVRDLIQTETNTIHQIERRAELYASPSEQND